MPVSATREYIYDAQDRMIEIKDNSVSVAKYAYDPIGRRVWRQAGTEITWFLYSNAGLIEEITLTGSEFRSYGWSPRGLWGTDMVWQKDLNGLFLSNNDQIYTTEILTSGVSGVNSWSGIRESFGKTTVSNGAITNYLMRLPGQWEDPQTKINQNFNRDYFNYLGRYSEIERYGLTELNIYLYSKNNPSAGFDSLGNMTQYRNCSQKKRIKIMSAESAIKNKLKECAEKCDIDPNSLNRRSCVPCRYVKKILSNLDSMPVSCVPGTVCGEEYTGFLGFGQKMKVLPLAFKPGRCGCLEATIFHELLHSVIGGHTFEGYPTAQSPFDPVWAYERKCFPCGVPGYVEPPIRIELF